jgi:protein-serine/threonine kinase
MLLSNATRGVPHHYSSGPQSTDDGRIRRVELERRLHADVLMSEDRKLRHLQQHGKKESTFLRLRRTKLGLDNFRTVGILQWSSGTIVNNETCCTTGESHRKRCLWRGRLLSAVCLPRIHHLCKVRLVQKKDTGKIYAMKTLKKEAMLKKDQVVCLHITSMAPF